MLEDGTVRLGLIGDNIAASQAPRLHEVAGRLEGVRVRYERLVPRDLGLDFEAVFEMARISGFRGLNITYPYKERVLPLVAVPDPRVAAIGAVNTVIFGDEGPLGYNTDRSGFVAGYRRVLGVPPGRVCMVGAGGAGKAVAFGLLELGLSELAIFDLDLPKARALASALRSAAPNLSVEVMADVEAASTGASGLVNCTPVGMEGCPGTPVPAAHMAGAAWVFDAVYTPLQTQFLTNATAAGLRIMTGWELYFHQGVHAYEIFHGRPVDETALRRALVETG